MRIAEIVIGVGDVERAVDYYTQVCGFTHVRTVRTGEALVAELDADGQRVTLVPSTAGRMTLAVAGGSEKDARARLRATGTREGAASTVEDARWIPFNDPWGNQLGFFIDAPAGKPGGR